VTVRLQPGNNGIVVPVTGSSSSRQLTARLSVATTALGEQTASLRFLTLKDLLPWLGLAILVLILIVMTIVLLRKTKKQRRQGPPGAAGVRRPR
jgi:hypothetical protein